MNPFIENTVELVQGKTPVIMGILNITPDSFFDGGQFDQLETAVAHALKMQSEGAAIIDVGGESTRPGATAVSVDEEIQRVVPVIAAIRKKSEVLISIDTSKPEVMRAAVSAGASLVNDVNALRAKGAVTTCCELSVPVCLMHMKGEPRTMQANPQYENVVDDVARYLKQRSEVCKQAGISKDRIVLDPGFGFGKTVKHNLELLECLQRICELNSPVLVGFSRKSMFGAILDRSVEKRLAGSLAALVIAYNRGVRLFRVHDVAESSDALKVCEAVCKAVNN